MQGEKKRKRKIPNNIFVGYEQMQKGEGFGSPFFLLF